MIQYTWYLFNIPLFRKPFNSDLSAFNASCSYKNVSKIYTAITLIDFDYCNQISKYEEKCYQRNQFNLG